MIQFKIENPNQYNPTDIVRVTVTIKEGANKEEVIQTVSKEMEGLSFELHNTVIYDKGFTANVQYSLIEKLENIKGVECVKISKKAELTSPSINQTVEIQPQEEPIDTTPFIVGGLGIIILGALILKKIKK